MVEQVVDLRWVAVEAVEADILVVLEPCITLACEEKVAAKEAARAAAKDTEAARACEERANTAQCPSSTATTTTSALRHVVASGFRQVFAGSDEMLDEHKRCCRNAIRRHCQENPSYLLIEEDIRL